jgi:hypothetical protein
MQYLDTLSRRAQGCVALVQPLQDGHTFANFAFFCQHLQHLDFIQGPKFSV